MGLLLKSKILDRQVLQKSFVGFGENSSDDNSQSSSEIYKKWFSHPQLPSNIKVIPDSNRGEKMANGFRRAIIRKGLISPNELSIASGDYESLAKADDGPRIVARAWSDPIFHQQLLSDAGAALAELNIRANTVTKYIKTKVVFVENSMSVHNIVICPEFNYYPLSILGMPPPWYKNKEYVTLALSSPDDLLKAFNIGLPSSIEIRIHQCTPDTRYVVLPMHPTATKGWSEKKLRKLVTR